MLYVQHVCQHVQTLLRCLSFVDDDGIVEVASLDEISLQQRFNVANEDKRAGTCYFLGEFLHVVECGKLRVDEFRLKGAHCRDRELIIRQNRDNRARLLILDLNLVAYDVPVFRCVLFLDTHLVNLFHILNSRTVENREFRTVHLNETVVDA